MPKQRSCDINYLVIDNSLFMQQLTLLFHTSLDHWSDKIFQL